jgi:hypothetical protein
VARSTRDTGGGTRTGTDGRDGDGTDRSSDRSASDGTGDETGETLSVQSSVEEVDPSPDSPLVILEAIDVEEPRRRRGRPRKLPTGDSDVPAPTANKRAQFYISILRDTWMDIHGFAGSLIDDELKWTLDESTRFAEAAYEVCRSHNWLSALERMTEARVIVIILSIETQKVQKVLSKQKAQPQEHIQQTPPLVRRASNGREPSPQHSGGDIPSFIPAPKFISQQ